MNTGAVVKQNGSGIIHLCGILSFQTVPNLLLQTKDLFEDHGQGDVQVDLSEVARSDSAGVALLVEWMNEARRQKREIEFLNVPSQMLGIVRVSSLDEVLPLHRG